jgi:short-subunit dehydrogenase
VNLDGRSVLLTGATGGIGQAIARALAARGSRLVLTGRRAEVLEPLAAEIGGRAVACDLASADEVSRLLGECSNADVLVANAALPASGELGSFSVEEIDRALAVNLRAPIVLAQALSKGMVARSHGHIVFVSSLSGKAASARGSIYSATKFGLRGFALGLREDLRDTGVGVSTVFPGFISDAGMFHESGARLPGYVAMKTPDDVAAAVVRAIERNRAEIDVAPLGLRLGTAVAGLLPELSGRVQRRLGSLEIAESMAEGQRDKR